MRFSFVPAAVLSLSGLVSFTGLSAAPPGVLLGEYFLQDPLVDSRSVVSGDALSRLSWNHDRPAWPGDRPGSLTALYDSTMAPGLFGFPLADDLDQTGEFTAAAILVIDSDEFQADPQGFFQIAWGVWNSATTGLERTGNFTDFAGDTFDLLAFDYFPNVSPWFGGPYLSPSIFGEADPEHPSFDFLGSFANASFAFGPQLELPFDEPLLTVLEHRPDEDRVLVSVHRIVGPRRTEPLPGAEVEIDLSQLGFRGYGLNTAGLTLWQDGFGGVEPSLRARVDYHGFVVIDGAPESIDELLRLPPARR